MEYYSAVARNEALIGAMTQINLRNYMLSEKSQSPKVTYYDSIYVNYPEAGNLLTQRVDQWLPEADGSYCLMYVGFLFRIMKMFGTGKATVT